jgi:hypothetical protein
MTLKRHRLSCVLTLIVAARLGATSVPGLSFEDLTDRSELVISGQVTRSWSDWDSEHKYIWTHHEVRVTGTYKGAAGSTVVLSEPGGVVGDRGMAIAGAVAYAAGEQVAVFLQRMPNGYLRTTGWAQGKFTVSASGLLRGAPSAGVELVRPGSGPAGTSLRSLEGISLNTLRTRVAARVAAQGQGNKN